MIILLGIVSFVGVFLFLVLSSNQARSSRLGRKQARRAFPDDKNLQKVYVCLVRDGKRYARLLSLYTAAQKHLQDGSVVSFRASSLDQFRKQSPEKVFKRAVSEDSYITSFWSRWFGSVESGFYDALNSLDPNEEEVDFRLACGLFEMGELKFREYNRVRMAMDAEIGNRFSRLEIFQPVAWRYDSPGGAGSIITIPVESTGCSFSLCSQSRKPTILSASRSLTDSASPQSSARQSEKS